MKITFKFTDTPDLERLTADDIYASQLEVPDSALHLIGVRERVLAIGELAAEFTDAAMYLSCKELDFKDYLLNSSVIPDGKSRLAHNFKSFNLYFERRYSGVTHKRLLRILGPVEPIVPQAYLFRHGNRRERKSLTKNLISLNTRWYKSETDQAFGSQLEMLSQHILVLLNSEPVLNSSYYWYCKGFHPWWTDNILIDQLNKRDKEREAERRKREREEAKRLEREAKLKERAATIRPNENEIPKSGAGRRPGARPGIYKNVSMRSQLEIRFAAELDERNIRWVYEGEVLGAAGYLVDFYLPDLGVWVEVKGIFEARDRQVLPEVAKYLKQERKHRLLVYMQSKAYVVNPSGFREIEKKRFWDELVK